MGGAARLRLIPGVELVGSGSGGFDLTDPFDCHVYLVSAGQEAALVDAGIGADPDAIVANVEAAGVARDAVRYLLLTHAHPDHAGGATGLRARLPHLEVVASPDVARWVRSGDEDAMGVEAGKRAEFYPASFRAEACAVEREVVEGDVVRVGGLGLEVIETPGHSDGHLAFAACVDGRRVLFAGDLVFYGGQISLANRWDCHVEPYAASMRKFVGAAIDALFPGHHAVTLARGQRHVDAANRLFESGLVPPSVV